MGLGLLRARSPHIPASGEAAKNAHNWAEGIALPVAKREEDK